MSEEQGAIDRGFELAKSGHVEKVSDIDAAVILWATAKMLIKDGGSESQAFNIMGHSVRRFIKIIKKKHCE